jgi:hypothetical protein
MERCPNCEAAINGAFCAKCGQKVAPLNPSLRESLHDLVPELLDVDGKTFRSVRLLLTKPGFLSGEQFEGRRARYVSALRLYLIFSVLYFAVASFAPDAAFQVNISFTPDEGDTPQEIAEAQARLPEVRKAALVNMVEWLPRAMFVLVPLLAGLVALVVRKSRLNYPQHLYFALHVQAAWFFASAVGAASRIKTIPAITAAVPTLALIYAAVYIVLAFRRAYGVSVAGALLRAAVVTGVYVFLALGAMLASIAPVVFGR